MDANSVLADEAQSIVAVKCFFTHQIAVIRLGIPAVRVVVIRPMIPSFGISSRLSGNPTTEVTSVSFRLTSVFPWLFMRFWRLRLPKAEYKWLTAHKVRNSGAWVYFSPKSVKIAGCDRAMTAAAAGTTRNAAYFTENWKTFLSVSVSFCGSSLEKAGNSTVDIGVGRRATCDLHDFDGICFT